LFVVVVVVVAMSSQQVDDDGPSLAEAISLMMRGATMLKCGRAGQPHFRHFLLLSDMHTLQWTSPKKKADQSVGMLGLGWVGLGWVGWVGVGLDWVGLA
jgi:hypothetical protein